MRRLVPLVLLFVALSPRAVAKKDAPAFTVIVHPDNPVSSVSRSFLRDAYLRKTPQWRTGKTIRPVDLSHEFAARKQFVEAVIGKTPAQLRTYWNQQIFSGKSVPPPEARSTVDVIRFVMANPGAVGYLPAGVDPWRAKVVRIE